MKTLLLASVCLLSTPVFAIEPPVELAAIGTAAQACYEAAAKDFAKSAISHPLDYQAHVDYEMNTIKHRARLFNVSTRCEVDVSSTTYFIANFSGCGLSSPNDYVTLSPESTCRFPNIAYNVKDTNDGYDLVGNPINPRKVFVKAWLDAGTCGEDPLPLRNTHTWQRTSLSVNVAHLTNCLRQILPPQP